MRLLWYWWARAGALTTAATCRSTAVSVYQRYPAFERTKTKQAPLEIVDPNFIRFKNMYRFYFSSIYESSSINMMQLIDWLAIDWLEI